MNVIRPGGIGSHRILSQAEHSVEVIFETLGGEAGERSHYGLRTLKGVTEKEERARRSQTCREQEADRLGTRGAGHEARA